MLYLGLVYLWSQLVLTPVDCGKGINIALMMFDHLMAVVFSLVSAVPVNVVTSSLTVTEGEVASVCVLINRSTPAFFPLSIFPQPLPVAVQFLTAGSHSRSYCWP